MAPSLKQYGILWMLMRSVALKKEDELISQSLELEAYPKVEQGDNRWE